MYVRQVSRPTPTAEDDPERERESEPIRTPGPIDPAPTSRPADGRETAREAGRRPVIESTDERRPDETGTARIRGTETIPAESESTARSRARETASTRDTADRAQDGSASGSRTRGADETGQSGSVSSTGTQTSFATGIARGSTWSGAGASTSAVHPHISAEDREHPFALGATEKSSLAATDALSGAEG